MANNKKNEAITARDVDFAKWYTDVCRKAELMDYSGVKGFIIYRPYGYALWEQIQNHMDKKFKETGLTREKASHVGVPMIKESPVCIECRVREIKELGSHSTFVADVLAVHVDDKYMDEKGKFDLALANPIVYSHGEYYGLGKKLGTFGYSIRKQRKKRQKK